MPVMTPEQRQKRVDRARGDLQKHINRRDRLEAQLAEVRRLVAEAQAELDWWARPVGPEPQPETDARP